MWEVRDSMGQTGPGLRLRHKHSDINIYFLVQSMNNTIIIP